MQKPGFVIVMEAAGIPTSFLGSSFSGARVLHPIKKIVESTIAAMIKAATMRKLTFFIVEILMVLVILSCKSQQSCN